MIAFGCDFAFATATLPELLAVEDFGGAWTFCCSLNCCAGGGCADGAAIEAARDDPSLAKCWSWACECFCFFPFFCPITFLNCMSTHQEGLGAETLLWHILPIRGLWKERHPLAGRQWGPDQIYLYIYIYMYIYIYVYTIDTPYIYI